jgi:hypothetical protein
MTGQIHFACVSWRPSPQGRRALPSGEVYSTVARFEEDGGNWQQGAWSVVLEFSPAPSIQGNPSTGRVRFLSENAPAERLRSGRSFLLYEGEREVATVEVL